MVAVVTSYGSAMVLVLLIRRFLGLIVTGDSS